jgi:hypothetical protein
MRFICGVSHGRKYCFKSFKTLAGLLYHIAQRHTRRDKDNGRYDLAEVALKMGL